MSNSKRAPRIDAIAVNRANPIAETAERLGIKFAKRGGKHWEAHCPRHVGKSGRAFKATPSKNIAHCFSCNATWDSIALVQEVLNLNFQAAVEWLTGEAVSELAAETPEQRKAREEALAAEVAKDRRHRMNLARTIWQESQPLSPQSSTVYYLKARGIEEATLAAVATQGELREHPDLLAEKHRYLPAMVAGLTCQASAGRVAVHRTFLDPFQDGPVVKAQFEGDASAKRMLGPTKGTTIRLTPLTSPRLILTEGIENALSIWQALRRRSPDSTTAVWAAGSLGNLRAVVLPPEVQSVGLAADNDMQQPAAEHPEIHAALEHLRTLTGREAKLLVPPRGEDFNDLLKGDLQ